MSRKRGTKMIKMFFPTAIALFAIAGAVYASKRDIEQNGGVEPALDRDRDGAAKMLDQAKRSSLSSTIMGMFSSLRKRVFGNDNETAEQESDRHARG